MDGTRILVLAHDLDIRVLTTHGELIRQLRLNPDRDYQPQPKRERFPETPVNHVPRHHMGAPGRIRTCAPASGGRCSIP
jgi:hypothetical protein